MFNYIYGIATRLCCLALVSSLADGLVAFSNSLSGDMDDFRVIEHFIDISVDGCWKECGRHMSCAHAVYERLYHLCTLLEGLDTPPMQKHGSVVASKGSGLNDVSKVCLLKSV